MFEPLPAQFDFPAAERRVLAFWQKHDIFGRSLAIRHDAPRFVFYEGPPTANGLPHPGHCLTRAMKDLFPRYQTMTGHLVERKAGWDTHGLPVEVEVCKELGIHSKEEIEAYGVEKFVKRCIESVFRYTREWEDMTRRLGFWVNLEDAYVTYHQSYVESVWWSLKTLFERGLLYQGHKVVWWWAQGGTALSAGEVGEGYRTVRDPSVYVRFTFEDPRPRVGPIFGQKLSGAPPVSLLVWTTTPWTLISNHFAAVGPDIDYSLVHDVAADEYFVIATALVSDVARRVKRDLTPVSRCRGADLVGLHYLPPFDCYLQSLEDEWAETKAGPSKTVAWRVVSGDFVDLATGTGIVHIAPAYGEVDFGLLQEERKDFAEFDAIPLLNAVAPDGTFTHEAPPAYRGRWVKDCDKEIIRELKDRGLLLHQETIEHEYPFCPRAENDPLIQYARKSWFVRTSQFKEDLLRNNDGIHWLPDHIQQGRFGDFLRNNVDWALSRERYWGTPLPIWVCEQTGRMEAIGSLAELTAKPGASDGGFWEQKVAEARQAGETLPEHLRVHKPYIDEWTYDSPFVGEGNEATRQQGNEAKARMRRVPEVIDCWWDAGSMPFAQWGYPHAPGSVETFGGRFPADFISEAIDQTRGWFYGLLAISTLLFGPDERGDARGDNSLSAIRHSPFPHPYRTCIVLGHMMGEDGNKMSKRLRNYKEPTYIFDTYGADAMRWYFFCAQVPWTSTRFVEASIRDTQREFLVRLYNVFSFFNIYANIDGFVAHPTHGSPWRPTPERSELDRWIISELMRTVRFVREKMDAFENYPAAGRINEFVDALSNWYVRRSRERFWKPVEATKGAVASDVSVRRAAHEAPGTQHSPSDQDKWDAYHTLYGVLLELSKLIAPFTPFFAETMYRNLTGQSDDGMEGAVASDVSVRRGPVENRSHNAENRFHNGTQHSALCLPRPLACAQGSDRAHSSLITHHSSLSTQHSALSTPPLSVHLCDYPVADEALIDERLAEEMDLVRDIVSLGRAARTAAKLKVRQPLARVEIILARHEHADWVENHRALIAEELNIKTVEFTTEADHYVTYQVKPDFKALGPKFGKLAPKIAAALGTLDAAEARRALAGSGELTLTVDGVPVRLTGGEVHVRLEARPGWSAAQGRAGVVVVQTDLTPELIDEGRIREFIHHVQAQRKELDLAYEARVTLHVQGPEAFLAIVRRFTDAIRHECLADAIEFTPPPAGAGVPVKVDEHALNLAVVPRA